jgi:hypothetical protein
MVDRTGEFGLFDLFSSAPIEDAAWGALWNGLISLITESAKYLSGDKKANILAATLSGAAGGFVSAFGLGGAAAGGFITQFCTNMAEGNGLFTSTRRALVSAGLAGASTALVLSGFQATVEEAEISMLCTLDADSCVDAGTACGAV